MSEQKNNAMVIDDRDTVAVAIEPICAQEVIRWPDQAGKKHEITARTDIPIYHKFAIKEMAKGEPVVKYGEHIGLASKDIHIGEHVHVHNVENHREQL